jgi:serine/threonine-protein kinase
LDDRLHVHRARDAPSPTKILTYYRRVKGPDLSGTILDKRYQIVERISEGAMGVVYRGLRTKLNRSVAIKVMHASLPGAMAARERFEREAKLMALLEHPHCVSVIDYGLHDNKPYVVMELVRGRSLHDLIVEQGRFDVPRATDILRQVLSGLAHAHEQGIIHRDIKPANIMITPKAPLGVHARILDFGLARLHESSGSLSHGVVVGTPSYMAPEQCRGDKIDVRVDLYACGIVLFEMLTGKKPFVASDPIGIVKKQVEDPPPRLVDIMPGSYGELEGVVARALAKSPDERFPSAVAMSEALDAAVAGRVAPEATTQMTQAIADSELIPVEGSVDVPISVSLGTTPSDASTNQLHAKRIRDPRDASKLRRMLPVSRTRWAVLLGLVVTAAAIGGLVIAKLDLGGGDARTDAAPRRDAAAAVEPDVTLDRDPAAEAVAHVNALLDADRRDSAIKEAVAVRKQFPDSAAVAFVAGKAYFAKLYYSDGVKQLRDAIRLDSRYRSNDELIKIVLRGFTTTPEYDDRLGSLLVEIGAPAAPLLEEISRTHPNPAVRARAAAELRRLH